MTSAPHAVEGWSPFPSTHLYDPPLPAAGGLGTGATQQTAAQSQAGAQLGNRDKKSS